MAETTAFLMWYSSIENLIFSWIRRNIPLDMTKCIDEHPRPRDDYVFVIHIPSHPVPAKRNTGGWTEPSILSPCSPADRPRN